jgi:hypothetical protein
VHYFSPSDIVAEAVGAELILLDLDQGSAFRLNATGKVVWQLARQARTGAEIARQLAVTFAAPPDQVERDVDRVLGELVRHRLLAPVPGGGR